LPGNLLPRPSLLLNPWSIGSAASTVQEAAAGGAYANFADALGGGGGGGGMVGAKRAALDGAVAIANHAKYATFDFLHQPAVVLANLRPGDAGDAAGVVSVDIAALLPALAAAAAAAGSGGSAASGVGESKAADGKEERATAPAWTGGDVCLTIVAADAQFTAATTATVSTAAFAGGAAAGAGGAAAYNGLALAPFRDLGKGTGAGLDPSVHVVQKSKISLLAAAGDHIDLAASASTTKLESYGSLDRVYALMCAQSSNATLSVEWSW